MNKESTKPNNSTSPEKVDILNTQPTESGPIGSDPLALYLVVLEILRKPTRHLTSAPTFTPRNLAESIQFYDDATNRRLYVYINGSWRFSALT